MGSDNVPKICIDFDHHLIQYFVVKTDTDVRVIRRDSNMEMYRKVFPQNRIITREDVINTMLEFTSLPPIIVNMYDDI